MHRRFRPLCEASDSTDDSFVSFHLQVRKTRSRPRCALYSYRSATIGSTRMARRAGT